MYHDRYTGHGFVNHEWVRLGSFHILPGLMALYFASRIASTAFVCGLTFMPTKQPEYNIFNFSTPRTYRQRMGIFRRIFCAPVT
jgi:hypothetical protein